MRSQRLPRRTYALRTACNRKIIQDAFEAWRDGSGAITDVFAPDMVARLPASAPFRPTTIRSVSADGDTVIVLWDGRGVASDGRPYENTCAWFMTLRDGKVVDGTAFYDSIAFNDLRTRVRPRTRA